MDQAQTTAASGRPGAGSSKFAVGSVACAGVAGLVAGALLPLVGRQLRGALGRFLPPPPAQQPAAKPAAGTRSSADAKAAAADVGDTPVDSASLLAAGEAPATLTSEPTAATAAGTAAATSVARTDAGVDLADVAVTWIRPPHPNWRAPERLLPPFPVPSAADRGGKGEEDGREDKKAGDEGGEMGVVSVRVAECSSSVLYPLVISTVVPRPIAFISTLSKTGIGNLSPYSYFNAVAHNPPLLAIGHCWSSGKPKDSLTNILDTRELVVALMSDWFVEAANHTCGPYPPDVNEMRLAGLTPVPSVAVKPPRVAESAVNMECVVRHTYNVIDRDGSVTTTVVLAEVVMFHFSEQVVTRTPNTGKLIVDPVKLRPMCRLGGNTYGFVSHLFDIARPDKDGRYPGHDGFVRSERDKIISQ
ncbi:hypothetical protein CLOM_g665 [Closterium sp. NIES-68]|nr:hypothetical protein CLOM_g665 [Closterium sp. NIES-68]